MNINSDEVFDLPFPSDRSLPFATIRTIANTRHDQTRPPMVVLTTRSRSGPRSESFADMLRKCLNNEHSKDVDVVFMDDPNRGMQRCRPTSPSLALLTRATVAVRPPRPGPAGLVPL